MKHYFAYRARKKQESNIMEANNRLEQLAASETNRIAAAILRGEQPPAPDDPVQVERSEADILKSVEHAYRGVLGGETEKK